MGKRQFIHWHYLSNLKIKKSIPSHYHTFSFSLSSEVGTAFDDQSSSLIKLNNSTVLYLREVNKFLALVCILREYSFSRQGVIDFNFLCFREAIHKVFEIKKSANELYGVDDDDDVSEEQEDEEDVEDQDGDHSDSDVDTSANNDDFNSRRQYIRSRYEPEEPTRTANLM